METEGTRDMAIDSIVVSPLNPRQKLDPESLAPLVESIKAHGMIGPILVRPGKGQNGGGWECIAGSRRLEASRLAGIKRIPVIMCRRLSDAEALEIALVENLQREDLDPIEEAEGYRRLRDEFGLTQARIAERVGKRQMHVSHALSLLKLPPQVQEDLRAGKLSRAHGHLLATVDDPKLCKRLAKKAAEVTCHTLEGMIQAAQGPKRKRISGNSLSAALHRLTVSVNEAAASGWYPALRLSGAASHVELLWRLTHFIREEAGLPPLDTTPQEWLDAQRLVHEEGLTWKAAGERLGVSDACIGVWLNRLKSVPGALAGGAE